MPDENKIACPHCEAKLEVGSRFCNYCGRALNKDVEKPRRKPTEPVDENEIAAITSNAERALKTAQKLGASVDHVRRALEQVKGRLADGDLNEAGVEARAALRGAQEAKERRKKELMILNARLFVDKAHELGADVSDAYDLIGKAEAALEEGVFGDVVEYVRKAKTEASEEKRKRRARLMILNFKPKLGYAREIGADVACAEQYLREAQDALERGVYGAVQENLKLARTEVAEVKRLKRASDSIESIRSAIESARTAGADVSNAEQSLREASSALEKREYDDFKTFSRKARKEAEKSRQTIEVATSLDSLSQEIGYIKSIDVDTSRAEDLTNKVQEALGGGDPTRASRYLSQLKTWLTKEKKKLGAVDEDVPVQMLALSKRLRDIRDVVDRVRKVGVDISQVEELFEEANAAFQEKDLEKSERILTTIEELATGLQETLSHAAQEMLAKAKSDVEEARKDNLRVGSASETVRSGFRALEEGHIDEALQYAEVARNMIEKVQRDKVIDLAKSSILRMEVILDEAKKLGVDVDEAEDVYRKASSDFDKGQFENVDSYLPKVEMLTKRAERLFVSARARDEMEGASYAIDDVEKLGADVSEAKSLLKRARESLFEENYDAVMELSRRIRDLVGEAEKDKIIQRFGAKSRGIATMISGAKTLGIDIEHAQSLLQMADDYLSKEEIVQAKDLIRRAEVSAGKKIQDFIKDKYPKLLVNVPEKGFQADVWNRLILEIINEGDLRSEDIDIRLDGDFEIKGLEKIVGIDPNEKKTIEVGLKPKRDGEIPLDLSVSYKRPFDSQVFSQDDVKQMSVKAYGTYVVEDVFLVHNDGRLIGHETRRFREDIDEDIFSGMLTIVQDFVKDSFRKRTEGGLKRLDFGGNMIVIERGPHIYLACVVAGDEPVLLPLHMVEVIDEIEAEFGEVLEDWSGMLKELEGVDEMIMKLMYVSDAAGADLVSLEKSSVVRTIQAIEDAKSAGADITEAETMIHDAVENIDKHDWKKAWDLVKQAEESANSSRVEYIAMVEEQLASAREIVEKASDMGIDIADAEELFETATEAINSGKFATITAVVKRIRDLISQGEVEIRRHESEKDLREARLLIDAAMQEGYDVFEAERLLRSAQSSYDAADLDEVSRLLSSVSGEVENSRRKRVDEDLRRRIDSFESVILTARDAGMDVTEAEKLAEEARSSLDAEDLEGAESRVRRLEELVERTRRRLILSDAEKRLREVIDLVERARRVGLSVDSARRIVEKAESQLESGDLELIEGLVKDAEGSTRKEIEEFLKDRRPRLMIQLPKKGFQEDAWNRYRLEIENRGNLGAKDIDVKLEGDFEVKGLEPIEEIDVNQKKHIDVGIRPTKSGELPAEASVSYKRLLDDKNYETFAQEELRIQSAGTYLVEDVFLIHGRGRLILNESRRYREDLDEKRFSGMVGAVESFVKDSFRDRASGLSRMDFGDSKVVIERGKSVNLALVVVGDEPKLLPLYIVEVLNEIEEEYGGVLEDWNGSMEGLEGIRMLVRKLLFMSELPGADIGSLDDSLISRAFGLGRHGQPALSQEEADRLVEDISREIEDEDYERLWKKVSEAVSAAVDEHTPGAGEEELLSTISVEILKSGVGELEDEEKLREYISLINEITRAVGKARLERGADENEAVLVAILPASEDVKQAVEILERIIQDEANVHTLEVVEVGDEWDGLQITAIPHLEMILGKYRFWAKKIETLLKSQSAWKIKQGLDKGAYFVGIEGQSVEITPNMVSFEILTPDNVIRQGFEGGSLYVQFMEHRDTFGTQEVADEGVEDDIKDPKQEGASMVSEIVDRIVEMRNDMDLGDAQFVDVKIHANGILLESLERERERILRDTNTRNLDFVSEDTIEGEEGYTIEWQVADETFTISLRESGAADSLA